MKILNIIEEGRFGGPQQRIIQVAERLKAMHGISTIVLIPANNSERTMCELKESSIPYKCIRLHRLTKNTKHLLGYLFYFIPEIMSIRKIIKEQKIDIVHINGSWQYKGLIAARTTNTRSLWHLNDTSMPWYILKIFNINAKYFSENYIFACQRSKEFYSVSSSYLKGHHKTIQAPVNTQKLNPDNYESLALSEFKGIKVLTVGNVVPVKGHDTFIEMAYIVSKKYQKEIHFFIAGAEWPNHENYISSLKKKVNDFKLQNVHFLGGRSDIPELLKSADIYVCSSNFEASPISVWEALSMGKAVVSTDVGDVRKIFKEYDCGLVVDTDNPSKLANTLCELIDNPDKVKHYQRQARKTAVDKFDMEICVQKHAEIYHKVNLGS